MPNQAFKELFEPETEEIQPRLEKKSTYLEDRLSWQQLYIVPNEDAIHDSKRLKYCGVAKCFDKQWINRLKWWLYYMLCENNK